MLVYVSVIFNISGEINNMNTGYSSSIADTEFPVECEIHFKTFSDLYFPQIEKKGKTCMHFLTEIYIFVIT